MEELFKDNPGLLRYAQAITDEYNRWFDQHAELSKHFGDLVDEGIAAFMCNAISGSVWRSSHQEVKTYFNLHAHKDN
jgi:hypothetical protein